MYLAKPYLCYSIWWRTESSLNTSCSDHRYLSFSTGWRPKTSKIQAVEAIDIFSYVWVIKPCEIQTVQVIYIYAFHMLG